MSISTKFGHSMSKGSRDTRGGPRRPPPVSGKDFLMPCGIGLSNVRFSKHVLAFKTHMNTDATYRTRRQRVRGAVNGFIWHRGFTGEKHVSEEPSSGSQEKIGFELIFWKSAKIDAKNLPTKIAMLTLKTCCDSHGWPFSNLRTGICSREQA